MGAGVSSLGGLHGHHSETLVDKKVRQVSESVADRSSAASPCQHLHSQRRWGVPIYFEDPQRKKQRYVAKRKERVDEALDQGATRTVKFEKAVQELRESTRELDELEDTLKKLQTKKDNSEEKTDRASRRLKNGRNKKKS